MGDRPDLSITEVAKLTGQSRNGIIKHMQNGEFPNSYKTSAGKNAKWRITGDDFDAYRERNRGVPA